MSLRNAYRWFHDGKIPNARQTASGRIYVEIDPEDCAGDCVADIHIGCLLKKLTDADAEKLVARLAEAGYVIEHRPADRSAHDHDMPQPG